MYIVEDIKNNKQIIFEDGMDDEIDKLINVGEFIEKAFIGDYVLIYQNYILNNKMFGIELYIR